MKFAGFCAVTLAFGALVGKAPKDNTKPVPAIQWTQSLEEATRLSKEQNRPIFIAINMEGFSEAESDAANDRMVQEIYTKDKVITASKQTINLIASAANHSYTLVDDGKGGKKKLCDRFKTISCEDHQKVEKAVRREYFKNATEVIAPQHLTVRPNGSVIELKEYEIGADQTEKMIKNAVQLVGKPTATTAIDQQQKESSKKGALKKP